MGYAAGQCTDGLIFWACKRGASPDGLVHSPLLLRSVMSRTMPWKPTGSSRAFLDEHDRCLNIHAVAVLSNLLPLKGLGGLTVRKTWFKLIEDLPCILLIHIVFGIHAGELIGGIAETVA